MAERLFLVPGYDILFSPGRDVADVYMTEQDTLFQMPVTENSRMPDPSTYSPSAGVLESAAMPDLDMQQPLENHDMFMPDNYMSIFDLVTPHPSLPTLQDNFLGDPASVRILVAGGRRSRQRPGAASSLSGSDDILDLRRSDI